MEFFKSAVASISKGPAFGYTFGDRVDMDQSIWQPRNSCGFTALRGPLLEPQCHPDPNLAHIEQYDDSMESGH